MSIVASEGAAGGQVERSVGPSARAPALSVVVPTYNRLQRLKRVLAALDAQVFPRDEFEVIVVSDGSTDGTDEYLRSLERTGLSFASQANAGPAAARNLGVELARAP